MNTIYKSKWNESTCTWVACSELTRGKTKSNCLKIFASIALTLATTSAFAAEECPPSSPLGEINISAQKCAMSSTEDDTMHMSKFTAKNSEIEASEKSFLVNNFNSNNTTSTTVGLDNSTLTVHGMHIDNHVGGLESKALHLNKSTLNIKSSKLHINNHDTNGVIEALIDIENNSNLKLSNNKLVIDNKNDSKVKNFIRNQDSSIDLGGDDGSIEIDDILGGATTTMISNIGNSNITAGHINLKHQYDSTMQVVGVHQKGKLGDKPQITANRELHITGQFQHAIKIESGDITSNKITEIHQLVSQTNPSSTPYAINIANGSYTNNGSTNIILLLNTTDGNEQPFNTEIPGIGLGDGGILKNNGTLTVNNGKNTAIRNFSGTNKVATIYNTGKIETSVDTIVNGVDANSQGTLIVHNSGQLASQNTGNTTTTGSVLKNSGVGELTINNQEKGTIIGNITNTKGGYITIDNQKSGEIKNGNIINKEIGNIDITNHAILQSGIKNEHSGTVTLTNTKTSSGEVVNNGTGNITINNQNQGQMSGNITNFGNEISADKYNYNIDITNSGQLTSFIANKGGGKINIINTGNITAQLNGIENTSFGDIILDNSQDINTNLYNKGNGEFNFKNSGNYSGQIENSGTTGTFKINNLGNINANSTIQNNGDDNNALITITNEGSLLAPISNNKAGQIKFTNKEAGVFEDSSLTNKRTGKILAINAGSFKNIGIINDDADGNIDFTNTDKGTFSGHLTSINSGTIKAMNAGIFTGTTNINPDPIQSTGTINLENQVSGTWENTGNSTLSNLTNAGIIKFPKISETDANDKNNYHTIKVKGDYTGGGNIHVNTIWHNDKNKPNFSDQLIIQGDVIGNSITTVHAINGIYGDVTISEIPRIHSATVIHVDGTTTDEAFRGDANTPNAGKAELKKIDSDTYGTGTDYAWVLTATPKPDPVPPTPTEPVQPDPADPAKPAPTEPVKPISPKPQKEVPIYAEPVSGYVQMPTVDMELGFTTIGTLHERRGKDQTYNTHSANNTALGDSQQQTWGRVLAKHLDKDGKKRLDTAGNQSVLQIGHDFILDEDDKTGARRHIGGYVAYGHNENDFRDQYRAEHGYLVDDHYTGKGRTDAVSIGGYGTFYGNNGGYVDLVGQVTYLRNKYNARSNESVHQNGWGAALSAEAGKSFVVYGNNWFVEPQAQLVYQYLSLDDFNDKYRHIDQHNPTALRGRIGMRFGYNGETTDNLPPSSFYGITNIWHDFVNPKSVDIGRDTLKEEYAKTWGEIGVGIQLPVTRQSNFYGDVRYEKNFGSDKRKGFKGTMGYKYTWL
ncbi:hypothetical protein BHC46_10650 [Snodgrassella alvi]|uniref:Autotransporter domain-containing protein n=1 Tax=Snodgrassella alvi TaxID=1196083 RepID=A0A2N9XCJ8_9NEIS|nr:autotransporter outer membrane beta-barrel domain-containing protein [Snodgrassella alvi]PIT44371.1 hypothetical protein BHC46_10650 [Snodgrassella alvi]